MKNPFFEEFPGNNPQFRSPRSDELSNGPFSRGDLNCYHRCAIWSAIRGKKEDFSGKWLDYPHSRKGSLSCDLFKNTNYGKKMSPPTELPEPLLPASSTRLRDIFQITGRPQRYILWQGVFSSLFCVRVPDTDKTVPEPI